MINQERTLMLNNTFRIVIALIGAITSWLAIAYAMTVYKNSILFWVILGIYYFICFYAVYKTDRIYWSKIRGYKSPNYISLFWAINGIIII